MGQRRSSRTAATQRTTLLRRIAETLTMNSLILYLAAVFMQRAWEILNSDVSVLLRRLH
jgi:hypothetical protein